ncbi:hypothetical protein [Brevundimonas diminuta]|uniref:hypothetical protein n=1 Tax=Brevundimonas diminuta TaxID=293 RepID=UPI003D0167C2
MGLDRCDKNMRQRNRPRLPRVDLAIDRLTDINGVYWLVREYRPTPHGFDLAIGWPDQAGPHGLTAILTAGVADYLIRTERSRDVNLPVGRITVKRLRAQLDLRFN